MSDIIKLSQFMKENNLKEQRTSEFLQSKDIQTLRIDFCFTKFIELEK